MKKNVETKVITIMMAASMAASICPAVPALAVTKNQVAADGIYTKTAHVTKTEEDVDDNWNEYDVEVTLSVEDGKLKDISVSPKNGYDSGNDSYFNKAYNMSKGIKTKLAGTDATEDSINSWDTVSGATRTSKAIKKAALEAIQSAPEASVAVTVDTTSLEGFIKSAEALTESDYTADSWSALKTALASAKTALYEKKSQDAVDKAASALDNAIQGLIKAEVTTESYVLMNIPYAAFYASDGVTSVDSVSSATLNKTRNSGLAAGSYHVYPNGSDITGITFPVKISNMEALKNYTQITDESSVSITVTNKGKTSTTEYKGKDALFESASYSYYILSKAPAYYKEATINADGTLSFGEVKGASKTTLSNVTSEFTTNTKYGDYQLKFDNLPESINTVYGVVIGTKEGGNYGLRQVENIWKKSKLAWSTGFVTTAHGCTLSYEPYKSMMGQTIDKVTYYTDDGIYEIPMGQKVPVKFDGEVSVADTSIDADSVQSSVTVSNLPEDFKEAYELAYSDGTVVDKNDYTVNVTPDAKGNVTRTLVFNSKPKKGRYTFRLSDESGTYADISTTFNMYTEAVPAQYNGKNDAPALEKSETASDEDFNTYLKSIKSVIVNGTSYAANGKGAVKLIQEDGSLDLTQAAFKDAKPGDAFTITIVEDGYKEYTFTYQVPVTDSEYTYVYAGLSWSEYWASEGVLAAGSTESSEELDSRGESDKGAFDVVTRATTNHGLHRGSFQCTAVIETKDGTTYNLAYWKDKDTFVTTDGQEVAFANVKANIKDYKVTGLKYVPVKVKTSDYEAFKEKYAVVEKDGILAGGYGEVNLKSYTATADVTENTNGLKTATKNADGTFSFGKRAAGTYSGLKDSQLKTATDLEPTVKEGDGSYGEFLRVDFNGNYGDLGANMQAVKWTYYGDDATYTNAKAGYGTKFAADNWMHKFLGIQLGLTDSIRCQLPAGTNGTGYWSLTIYALGYEDYTYTFQVGEENIAQPKAADQEDIAALKAKVDEAKALNKADYTEDSWSSMETELAESEELLKKDSLLSAEVKTQLQHMTDALDRLVQKEPETPSEPETVSTTALEKAIKTAEGLKEADYTADSWKALQNALSAAKATLNEKKDQTTVDAATENLNKAISALVKAASAEEKKTPAAQTSELKNTSGTDTKKTSGKVKTGDPASVFGWLTLAVSSLGAGGFALKRRKRRDDK